MWSTVHNGTTTNNYGQTMFGDVLFYETSPIQIGTLTIWSKIAAASKFSIAARTDGTIWSWGEHTSGGLGNGLNASSSAVDSPVQIGTLTNWVNVTASVATALALKS